MFVGVFTDDRLGVGLNRLGKLTLRGASPPDAPRVVREGPQNEERAERRPSNPP